MRNQKEMTPEEFNAKFCSKKELSMKYFPGSTPEAAARRLRRWIARIPELRRKLDEWNDTPAAHFYSRKHVELIARYLGEP